MANYILGVKTVKYGTPTTDGGMATQLDKQVAPYKESVSFEDEEGEVVKHFSEGARYPFLTIYSAAGTTFKFSVPMDNDSLKEWMGGEIVNGQWQAPRGNFQATKSLELRLSSTFLSVSQRPLVMGLDASGKRRQTSL